METIESITAVENVKMQPDAEWRDFDGYEVKTSKQVIKLGISNGQSCCESWGHFWMNDKPDDFVGAEVTAVTLTDTALKTEKAPEVYDGGIMFVNIETNRGTLQFTAYNAHNGYYGHEAVVICQQLEHSECL